MGQAGTKVARAKAAARTPQQFIRSVDKELEKKIISPRHPTTVQGYEELVEKNPHFKKGATERNDSLHTMLEAFHVDSTGVAPDQVLKTGAATSRASHQKIGKLNIEQIRELYNLNKQDGAAWGEVALAERYALDVEVCRSLLRNYSAFYIYKKPTPPAGDLSYDKDDKEAIVKYS